MRQLTGSKVSFRVLELNVSAKDGGFKPRQSRQWAKTADKILAAIEDYDSQVQALVDEGAAVDQLPDEERRRTIAGLNAEIRVLDDGIGQEQVTITFEDEEVRLLEEVWYDVKLPGDRKTRAWAEKVTAMLESAIEVEVKDGQVVPVEKVDRPHANGRPKTLAGRRR